MSTAQTNRKGPAWTRLGESMVEVKPEPQAGPKDYLLRTESGEIVRVHLDGAGNYHARDYSEGWSAIGAHTVFKKSDPAKRDTKKRRRAAPAERETATCAVGQTDLAAEVQRLAGLSPLEYDREREAVAQALGVRVGTLDKEVQKKRPDEPGEAKGRPIRLREPEPWTDPVDGASALDEADAAIARHMLMTEQERAAVALWCAHTYVFDRFSHTPRLLVTAPDAECGKTLLMYHMVGNLSNKPQSAELMKSAPFFRMTEAMQPTWLIDEMDVFIQEDSDLLAAVNAGFEPHGGVPRCVGEDFEVRLFPTFAPVAMAGIDLIKKLPASTISRSVVVNLDRAADDELPEPYDARHHRDALRQTARKLARWTRDNREAIQAADPELPPGARNRHADKWRPLLALADAAGGRWPKLARKAMTGATDEREPSKALQLLMDCKEVVRLGERVVSSSQLIERLCQMEDSPWTDYNFKARDDDKRRISNRQLATLLGRYKVKTQNVKLGQSVAKGYRVDCLASAWKRYLPATNPGTPEKSATPLLFKEINTLVVINPLPHKLAGSGFDERNYLNSKESSGVADNPGVPDAQRGNGARYLPPREDVPISTATPRQTSNDAASSQNQTATNSESVAVQNRREPSNGAGCRGVAVQNGGLTEWGEV